MFSILVKLLGNKMCFSMHTAPKNSTNIIYINMMSFTLMCSILVKMLGNKMCFS